MGELCYYNGQFHAYAQATVSGHDRGFNFGDGIYEVIRVYNGRPHAMRPHLERLERSARGIDIKLARSIASYEELIGQLIDRSGLREAMIYGQVTRGTTLRDHMYPDEIEASDFWFIRKLDTKAIRERIERGMKVITLEDDRWNHCDIKSISLLPNVLAKNRARRAGAQEAMYYEPGTRKVNEGGASNLYAVKDGTIYTAPKGPKILPGIIRTYILRFAGELGIPLVEEAQTVEFFKSADEVVASSSTMEIMPIRAIDGDPLRRAEERGHGPVFRRIVDAFLENVTKSCEIPAEATA